MNNLSFNIGFISYKLNKTTLENEINKEIILKVTNLSKETEITSFSNTLYNFKNFEKLELFLEFNEKKFFYEIKTITLEEHIISDLLNIGFKIKNETFYILFKNIDNSISKEYQLNNFKKFFQIDQIIFIN